MSSSSTPTAKKQTKGRQKIEIKRVEKQSNRQVTFSKRRAGLFKKAGELSVLTGAEIGIVIISPSKKVFSFGSPNLETIINRYANQSDDNKDADRKEVKVVNIEQDNKEYEELVKRLEEERMITRQLKARNKNSKMFWWQEEKNIEAMGMEELEEYIKAVKN